MLFGLSYSMFSNLLTMMNNLLNRLLHFFFFIVLQANLYINYKRKETVLLKKKTKKPAKNANKQTKRKFQIL